MKNISYLTKSVLFGLMLIFVFSCEKEEESNRQLIIEGPKVNISFSFPESKLKSGDNCGLDDAVSAIITIQKKDGEATEFTSTPIDIYKMNGMVFTQKIALEVGEYELVEFLLINNQGEVLSAIPMEDSPLAEYVDDPLPMDISVAKDLSRDYAVQVMCTNGFTPKDFGLTWFIIDCVEACHFLLSVSELGSNTLLAGNVVIESGEYEKTADFSASVVPNKIMIQCGLEEVNISIQVPGYEGYRLTLPTNELNAYTEKPMVVELLPIACEEEIITELVTENNEVIGVVTVEKNNNSIVLAYKVTEENWYLSETHVSVTQSLDEVPVDAAGNPLLSDFEYSTVHDPIVKTYTYVIPKSDAAVVDIMAHATVENLEKDLDLIEEILPDNEVNVEVRFTGHPSYFETTISGAGDIDGTYQGNCIDLDNGIVPGRNYEMRLVSTYTDDESLLEALVDKPENLDLVNYVINQDYSDIGATGEDIQAATWTLIDDIVPTNGTGGIVWNQSVVNQIIQDAMQNGEGFTPHCGEKAMVILDPGVKYDPTLKSQVTLAQITVVAFDNVCTPVQTNLEAWGEGLLFNSNSAAMYFSFCLE
jgi:hypothetical protein